MYTIRPTGSSSLACLKFLIQHSKNFSRRRRRRRRRRSSLKSKIQTNMRRNCNLELRLLPASPAYLSFSGSDSDHQERTEQLISHHEISPKTPNNQPLTIFYNGKICVCDVSEFKARAILSLASREIEERVSTPTVVGTSSGSGSGPCSPSLQSPVYSPISAQSMKRSLQSFLQKRKHRALTMSPYHHR